MTEGGRSGPISRVRNGFQRVWVPRLGAEAADRLGRMALLALLLAPAVIALSVAASLGITSGQAWPVGLGAAAVAAVVGLCLGWVRLSVELAAAVSRHFGRQIGWRQLPRFNPRLFDRWVAERGLQPAVRP